MNKSTQPFRFPRVLFLVLLLAPAAGIGYLAKSEATFIQFTLYYLGIWIPVITVLRMIAMGMSLREMLLAPFSFGGNRFKVFKKDPPN